MFSRPTEVGPDGPALLLTHEAPRVCIVLLSGVGDVVHGLPLANDIKRARPGSEVIWVAQPAPGAVLANHPAIDRVIIYDRPRSFDGLVALRRTMGDVRADLTLNIQRYFKSIGPTVFSGAPIRVGLPRSKTRDGVFLAHTHVLRDGPWQHSQDMFLDFRWALGVDRDRAPSWDIAFSPDERRAQADFFGPSGSRHRVGMVVASASVAKDWPAERYAELADALTRDFGYEVLLLGGPSPAERRLAESVEHHSGAPIRSCLGDGIRRLMWLLDGCDLVVSPDTGPLHIAHALGVPVIGLFGHTNPWRVGPYSRFHDLVIDRYTDTHSEPDPSAYAPKSGRMEMISVADVVQRVEIARQRYP